MSTEIRVPTLGESITEATVAQWYKKPGEAVSADEPLCELETDKVTIEVPAPSAGVMGDVVVEDGATVEVGAHNQDRRNPKFAFALRRNSRSCTGSLYTCIVSTSSAEAVAS